MATSKGRKPTEQLDPKVIRKLLDLLSTDNEFRRLFKRDAYAALVKAGYRAPAGRTPAESATATGGSCLQLRAGDRIAPKQKIIQQRARLEEYLALPFNFTFACPVALKA